MSSVIIGDIVPYTQATATGGQTVFSTNWTANVESDVVVYLTPSGSAPDDVTQILSYPSDFSVAFIGAAQEVQVTLVVGAGVGDTVTIIRNTPADRENLYSNTNFTPSMLNTDFGILTLVDQQAQLVDQKIGPRYNYSAIIVNVVDTILPILGANQVWAKNAGNTAIVAVTIGSGGISGVINVGLQNELAWYAANGVTISGLPTGNNGVLVTSAGGVPSISSSLPSGLVIPSPKITTGIYDANGNLSIAITATPSAVNYVTVNNASAAAATVGIAATGTSATVNMAVSSKNGDIKFQDTTVAALTKWYNAGNTHFIGFKVGTLSGDTTFTWPTADGTAGQFVKTDGAGNLAFSSTLPGVAWTAFTPTLTGFASTTSNLGRYILLGKVAIVQLNITGTSNATSFSLSNLPATAANTTIAATYLAYGTDNATPVITLVQITANSTTCTMYNGIAAAAWTNTGAKACIVTMTYETT